LSFLPPIFRIRDFRVLILTRWLIVMALQIQDVIVSWQVYQLKHDALLLGLLGLTEAVPAILCSFYAGHIVDNHRPAKIFINCLAVLSVNAVLLWIATSSWVDIHDDWRLIVMFSATFVSGIVRSFSSPSNSSLIPQLVPRELYSASAAIGSSVFQASAIVGPAIGGLVYGQFGSDAAFAMIPALSIASLVAVFWLTPHARSIRNTQQREKFSQSIMAGLRFVLKTKALLSSMMLDMFSVLFGGAVAVLPIYADQVLHIGASGLGFLRAAPAVGSLLVLMALTFRPLKVISGKTLLWVVAGFGTCILIFGLSHSVILSAVMLALSGAFDGVSMVIRQTIMQLLTPDQYRGRVSSVSLVFITSSNEIGAFESGLAASMMGLIPSVIFGATMTLLIVGGTALFFPELRRTQIEH